MGDCIEYRSIGGGDKFLLDVEFGLELLGEAGTLRRVSDGVAKINERKSEKVQKAVLCRSSAERGREREGGFRWAEVEGCSDDLLQATRSR